MNKPVIKKPGKVPRNGASPGSPAILLESERLQLEAFALCFGIRKEDIPALRERG